MSYCDTISYYIHLYISQWDIFNESHGIEFGKLASNKFDLFCELIVLFNSQDPVTTCWIAEAYEPYSTSLSISNKNTNYDIIHESCLQSNDPEVRRMKRSIVGTISIDDHRCLHDSGWLSHFAVRPDFNFEAAAEALIVHALKHAVDLQMKNVEMTTTECQMQLREVLTKIGFDIRQIYHRRIMGNSSSRVMKSQLGINLNNWTSSKRK